MKQCIKDQIAAKQAKLQAEHHERLHESAFEAIKDESEMSIEVIEEVSRDAVSLEQHEKEEKLEIGDGEEEMQFEEQQDFAKLGALSDLESEDFPGFYTIRSLVMMIDGSLFKPFFTRNRDN